MKNKIREEVRLVNRFTITKSITYSSIGRNIAVKLSLILSFLFITNTAFSQEIVQLHPVVGDTIGNSEKIAFYLFPEIADSSFIQGVIFFQHSTFKVNILEENKPDYTIDVDSTMLVEYNQNIEKLIQYYSKLQESDSLNQKQQLLSNSSAIQMSPECKLNAEERKKLITESRRYLRKKDRAEDLGLWGKEKEDYIKSSSNTNIFKGRIRF